MSRLCSQTDEMSCSEFCSGIQGFEDSVVLDSQLTIDMDVENVERDDRVVIGLGI